VTVKPESDHRSNWLSALALWLLVARCILSASCVTFVDGWFGTQGLVVNREGRPVPGATVQARNATAVTDRRGCFLIDEITSPGKHLMPFSVDAAGSKSFVGTLPAPGHLRLRVVLADSGSAGETAVETSPPPDTLLSCEPPRTSLWVKESAQTAGSTRIATLGELPAHLGEYPCRSGLLESPVLQTAIEDLLADDYDEYMLHLQYSGCNAVAQHGSWILLSVYRLVHRDGGGKASFILVNPQTARVHVFWLRDWGNGGKSAVYGSQPVPADVSRIIVDELTSIWGHFATFSWRDGAVQIVFTQGTNWQGRPEG